MENINLYLGLVEKLLLPVVGWVLIQLVNNIKETRKSIEALNISVQVALTKLSMVEKHAIRIEEVSKEDMRILSESLIKRIERLEDARLT